MCSCKRASDRAGRCDSDNSYVEIFRSLIDLDMYSFNVLLDPGYLHRGTARHSKGTPREDCSSGIKRATPPYCDEPTPQLHRKHVPDPRPLYALYNPA
jgi:hypothetical protein